MDQHPSVTTPSFTTERLKLLASEIARVRRDALETHEPGKGDNEWSFGCVCYCRTCFALSTLGDSPQHPWLKVEADGLSCTLLIEGEPLKFYRGDADHPSERSLRHGLEQAILQGKLAFFNDELARSEDGWFWLMAIETHEDGTVLRVVVFQANKARETRNQWFVPTEETVAVATAASAPEREGVDLDPPQVGPKLVGDRAAGDSDDGNEDDSS